MIHKIDALTGLRFFAAAAIFVHHLPDIPSYPVKMLAGWTGLLGQGVTVFFVLSGFILSYVYSDLKASGGVRHFLLARFARVWPAHAVMLLICVVAFGANPAAGVENQNVLPFLANLTLTQAFVPYPAYYFSFNGVSWSLSTELGFYLLFPFIIANLPSTWHWKIVLALACSFAMPLLAQRLELGSYNSLSAAMTYEGLVYISPLGRIFEFTLGVVTAHGFRTLQAKKILTSASPIFWTAVECVALGALLYNVTLFSKLIPLFGVSLPEQMQYWIFMSFSAAIPSALLILAIAMGRGALSMVLALPPMRVLGEISFSLYLVHQPIIQYIGRNDALFAGWGVPISVVAGLVAAACLWRFVEVPMRKVIMGIPSSRFLAMKPPAQYQSLRTPAE